MLFNNEILPSLLIKHVKFEAVQYNMFSYSILQNYINLTTSIWIKFRTFYTFSINYTKCAECTNFYACTNLLQVLSIYTCPPPPLIRHSWGPGKGD